MVLSLEVSDEQHDSIQKVLDEMYESKMEFGYDFVGLCLAAVKIEKRRDNKYYCSDFLKSILQKFEISGSETLRKFTEPEDFLSFPGVQIVYQGALKEFGKK